METQEICYIYDLLRKQAELERDKLEKFMAEHEGEINRIIENGLRSSEREKTELFVEWVNLKHMTETAERTANKFLYSSWFIKWAEDEYFTKKCI